MVAELTLATSLILSTMFPCVNGYLGEDMDDEDFELFIDTHYDIIEPVISFVDQHKNTFIAGAAGVATSNLLKAVGIAAGGNIGGFIIGGSVELVKNLYKDETNGKCAKQERLEELEKKFEDLVNKINEIEKNKDEEPTLLDFNDCQGYNSAKQSIREYEHRDSHGIHHMSDNSRHSRDHFHRTPSERHHDKIHPERVRERERMRESGLDNSERAYA